MQKQEEILTETKASSIDLAVSGLICVEIQSGSFTYRSHMLSECSCGYSSTCAVKSDLNAANMNTVCYVFNECNQKMCFKTVSQYKFSTAIF